MQTMNKMRYYFILFLCFFIFSCDFQKQGSSTGKPLEFILIQGEGCSDSAFNIFQKHFVALQTPLLETEIYGEQKNFFRVIPILEKVKTLFPETIISVDTYRCQIAKKAIELNPDEAHSYFSLALIYAQAKMIDKSKEQNEKALKLEPENLLALQMKATNQINDGFFKDGLTTYQKVRKIDPLFPIFVLQGEARAYLAFAEFEKAFNLSEEALVRNPRSTTAMLNYIVSAWKLGKKEDAKWQMEELRLNNNNLFLNKNDFSTRINNYPWHQVNKDLVISVYDEIIEDGS